jgi:membrane-anchored protein YejM (alkaline phosphatase superfamily)
MWGIHAAAPLNAVHLGYGIGAILINLLVRPYITKQSVSIDNQNIIVPYSVTAILCLIISVGHLTFYISKLRNRRQRLQVREVSPEENDLSFAR